MIVIVEQQRLARLRRMAREVSSLRARLKLAEQVYARASAPVLTALRNGARVEPGAILAAVKEHLRRSIAWRQEFEKAMGRAAVDVVLAANPPKQRWELVLTKRKSSKRAQAAA
jgi:hypothetical protein